MNLKRNLTALLICFVVSTSSAVAQITTDPVPCSGDADDPGYDPNGCYIPLDTWVYILVAAAFIYGVYYLHKNQKALSA